MNNIASCPTQRGALYPVVAPRPGTALPSPLKSNFLAVTFGVLTALDCFSGASSAKSFSLNDFFNTIRVEVLKTEERANQPLFVRIDIVEKGVTSTVKYNFAEGSTYEIVVVGNHAWLNDNKLNMDLMVFDSSGGVLGKDDTDQSSATVIFSPKRSGDISLQVSAANMKGRDVFYGLIISRKDE